jgi:hypothetical protein
MVGRSLVAREADRGSYKRQVQTGVYVCAYIEMHYVRSCFHRHTSIITRPLGIHIVRPRIGTRGPCRGQLDDGALLLLLPLKRERSGRNMMLMFLDGLVRQMIV